MIAIDMAVLNFPIWNYLSEGVTRQYEAASNQLLAQSVLRRMTIKIQSFETLGLDQGF